MENLGSLLDLGEVRFGDGRLFGALMPWARTSSDNRRAPASLEVRCLAAFQLVGELSAVRCKLIHNGVELIAANAPEASAPGAAIDDADVMGLKYVDDSVLLDGRLSERRHFRGRPQNTRC